ncbi:MAG: hypothetical protein ACYCVD_14325 [Desulfitobacteriaceae bacterium]
MSGGSGVTMKSDAKAACQCVIFCGKALVVISYDNELSKPHHEEDLTNASIHIVTHWFINEVEVTPHPSLRLYITNFDIFCNNHM